MRYLPHCFKNFLECKPEVSKFNNSKDMFLVPNFQVLRNAINNYCSEGEILKAGLKHSLQYTLILEALAYTEGNQEEPEEIHSFQLVFKLWENLIFGDAHLKLQTTDDKKARKPCELPVESDLSKLQDRLSIILSNTCHSPTRHEYIILRNATCARLTLYNARRGGEPARLLISDLLEGLNDK